MKKEELSGQLDYWGNECRKHAEEHDYSCETGCPYQERCEQAYQQIKEMVQSDEMLQCCEEINRISNFIIKKYIDEPVENESVADVVIRLLQKKPEATEEFIESLGHELYGLPRYDMVINRLTKRLKEAGVEVMEK